MADHSVTGYLVVSARTFAEYGADLSAYGVWKVANAGGGLQRALFAIRIIERASKDAVELRFALHDFLPVYREAGSSRRQKNNKARQPRLLSKNRDVLQVATTPLPSLKEHFRLIA